MLLLYQKDTGALERYAHGGHCYKKQQSYATAPNLKYIFEKVIDFDSHPTDWFDLWFPKDRTKYPYHKAVTINEITSWTNTKLTMTKTAGKGSRYSYFINFSKEKLMQHLALYLLHEISPSPQMKFTDPGEYLVNVSSLCNRLFEKNE